MSPRHSSSKGQYDTPVIGRQPGGHSRDFSVIPKRKPGRLAQIWEKLSGFLGF